MIVDSFDVCEELFDTESHLHRVASRATWYYITGLMTFTTIDTIESVVSEVAKLYLKLTLVSLY